MSTVLTSKGNKRISEKDVEAVRCRVNNRY